MTCFGDDTVTNVEPTKSWKELSSCLAFLLGFLLLLPCEEVHACLMECAVSMSCLLPLLEPSARCVRVAWWYSHHRSLSAVYRGCPSPAMASWTALDHKTHTVGPHSCQEQIFVGSWVNGSVGKSTSCENLRSSIWIPSIHAKSQEWLACAYKPSIWGTKIGWYQGSAEPQASDLVRGPNSW